jgi:hypothetical protein
MKKTIRLLSSCILCVLSSSAFADMDIRGERTSFYERNKPTPIGFNYTYFDIPLTYSIVENGTTTDDTAFTAGVKISFQTTPKTSASLKGTGGFYTFNNTIVETTELHIGVNYHHPFTKTMDGYTELNFISIDFNDPNNTTTSISESGTALTFGIRQRINPDSEIGFDLSSIKIGDDTNAKVHFSYSYGSDRDTQYTVGLESTNSDNKQTSLVVGIRLNY